MVVVEDDKVVVVEEKRRQRREVSPSDEFDYGLGLSDCDLATPISSPLSLLPLSSSFMPYRQPDVSISLYGVHIQMEHD